MSHAKNICCNSYINGTLTWPHLEVSNNTIARAKLTPF